MDWNAYRIIHYGYPHTVAAGDNGGLSQHFVHSSSEAVTYFDHNKQDKNLYFNIARFRSDMRPITGNVAFDFDSPMKEAAFEAGKNDREKIQEMRDDDDLARTVLGQVWDDAQTLVKWCWKNDVPVVSVFSGLGVHCHVLFQEQVNPKEEKTTTSQYLIDRLELDTYDAKIIPDTKRVLRIPNSKRIDNGIDCLTFCIPMTEKEVLNNSLVDMLERCKKPKSISVPDRYKPENRPQLQVYEDVDVDVETAGAVEVHEMEDVPKNIEYIVREMIPLPCVRERFLSANPDHMIRFSGCVHLYQAGFTPAEVRKIIRKIGWIDYDSGITKKMTDNIWKNNYSELPCSRLRTLGLCVYGMGEEEYEGQPTNCDTYNYTSGEALYPYQ